MSVIDNVSYLSKTISFAIKEFIRISDELVHIKLESRFATAIRTSHRFNYCIISVARPNCPIYRPHPFYRMCIFHTFNGPGMSFEFAVSIGNGDICWVNGHFDCANYSDVVIFRRDLTDKLVDIECVVSDDRYID